jgi:hypothetical protein
VPFQRSDLSQGALQDSWTGSPDERLLSMNDLGRSFVVPLTFAKWPIHTPFESCMGYQSCHCCGYGRSRTVSYHGLLSSPQSSCVAYHQPVFYPGLAIMIYPGHVNLEFAFCRRDTCIITQLETLVSSPIPCIDSFMFSPSSMFHNRCLEPLTSPNPQYWHCSFTQTSRT